MSASTKRLPELDFFRGLVLLIIVVDHIGGSILSRMTLHAFAWCDAAEVFVFLGGFAAATAYQALSLRSDARHAGRRFVRRALEIYRAFLLTAGLMLLVSAILRGCNIEAPNMDATDLDGLIQSPARVLRDILLLRRQPYLSAVLPMYAFFALAVPLVLPLARSRPVLLGCASIALWIAAPALAHTLPVIADTRWDFNPFAWQLLFVAGAITRCQPVYQRLSAHPLGSLVSLLSALCALSIAYQELFLDAVRVGGVLKQNLHWIRVLSFLSIAWLVANMIRKGWARRLAEWTPVVSEIGRRGLLCFVAGTVVSLSVDSVLYSLTNGLLNVPMGLAADAIALSAMVMVAKLAAPRTRKPYLPAPSGSSR